MIPGREFGTGPTFVGDRLWVPARLLPRTRAGVRVSVAFDPLRRERPTIDLENPVPDAAARIFVELRRRSLDLYAVAALAFRAQRRAGRQDRSTHVVCNRGQWHAVGGAIGRVAAVQVYLQAPDRWQRDQWAGEVRALASALADATALTVVLEYLIAGRITRVFRMEPQARRPDRALLEHFRAEGVARWARNSEN